MLEIRKAKEDDCKLFYTWANDEETRKNAFNTSEIPYEAHVKWFKDKINNKNTHIYVCMSKNDYIGQFRIEKEGDGGIIDYSVDIKYRGKGYGKEILNKIIECFKLGIFDVANLIGKVKLSNDASKKCFISAGFKLQDSYENFVLYKY